MRLIQTGESFFNLRGRIFGKFFLCMCLHEDFSVFVILFPRNK